MTGSDRFGRILFMGCLIVAGEAIFALPFHITRFFRPTVLDVFGLTATELGMAQALYGVTAMLSYFPGGPLADRFSARKLLTGSLILTAMGGLYYATIPPLASLRLMFGFYGITSVLLFWAAMIRACREWGTPTTQGRAYGLLDGGRGAFAAVMAFAAVLLLQVLMPEDPTMATDAERLNALRGVIFTYTGATLIAAVLVWFFVPDSQATPPTRAALLTNIGSVLKMPTVWLQAVIVVCAYVAYKGFDNYSLYVVDAWGLNEVEAARVSTIGAVGRPIAAVAAGFIGDRYNSGRVIFWLFAILTAAHAAFATLQPQPSLVWMLYGNIVVACLAMFGIRGLYFALLEAGRVPMHVTGVAIGVVSVIGYAPDIFTTWVAGAFVDASPGVAGHQHFFWFLAAFSLLGIVVTAAFNRLARAQESAGDLPT